MNRLMLALAAERDRWILWVPVALATGIALYFGLPFEPPRWIGPAVWLIATVMAVRWRHAAVVWPLTAASLIAFGFTDAVERSAAMRAPILAQATGPIRLQGRIAAIEPQENGQRLILDRLIWPALVPGEPAPQRVRLHVPIGITLRPGQPIVVEAALFPPPLPAAPGAFDFARQAWFLRVGAVGYALAPPVVLDRDRREGRVEALRLWIAEQRHRLTERIVAAVVASGLSPGIGATAAALITAERGPVAPETLQAFRDAGLAHILVIAGMHLSMVAGLVFVALRALLALVPAVALRIDIKKLTAVGALAITFAYLIIAGAPVPTRRAFIMNGIILLAVILDRDAVSLRSITAAASVILLCEPEALLGASFQLSFAAVYGLISAYEVAGPRMAAWRRAHPGWFGGVRLYIAGILLTTQVAGSATAFYTVFHFNRYASYGLLGNLLAVPLVGVWVMPSALLAFLLMPFGADGWAWGLMGHGIATVSTIAHAVSALPGASFDFAAMSISVSLLFTLGGFWLCLWRRRWRLWGLLPMGAALLVYALQRPPDMLVDGGGRLIALRDADGGWRLSSGRAAKTVRQAWLRQAGQGETMRPWRPSARLHCEGAICYYRVDQRTVALLRCEATAVALADGCRQADLVVAPAAIGGSCAPPVRLIDRTALARDGTYAIWLRSPLRFLTVADWQGARPWSQRGASAAPESLSDETTAWPPMDWPVRDDQRRQDL